MVRLQDSQTQHNHLIENVIVFAAICSGHQQGHRDFSDPHPVQIAHFRPRIWLTVLRDSRGKVKPYLFTQLAGRRFSSIREMTALRSLRL